MRKLSCKSAAWLALGAIISFSTLAAKTDPAIGDIGPTAEAYIASHPDKVGEAVATYLADHPEFLIAASETLHQAPAGCPEAGLCAAGAAVPL
ncbi:Uncharacterised protein [Klebsiella aerogenes]|nr:Uncharacterised protein [Klebsiella aerogenes]